MNNLISVIVPIYNVERYLRKCVDSILCQSYTNLEIFLVDDGASDNCGRICDEYALKDSRIRVIHKENGGLSDARNVAIDVTQGEYLTFIDSDDYVAPDYIETLWLLVKKYNCKVSVSLFNTFYENEQPKEYKNELVEEVWDSQKAVEHMFYQKIFDNTACAKMYHYSLFKETCIRFPKGLLFEDLYTTYKLLLNSDKVAFCNKKTYFYLLRPTSIEGSIFSDKKMDSALSVFNSMEQNIDILHPIEKSYRCRMLSFSFHLLVKMPDNYEKRDLLYNYIKQYRRTVLLDKKARTKTRIACFLSYLGMTVVKGLFVFVDKRR